MTFTLAIDQGTTGTTVLVVDATGHIVGRGYQEHPQHFPQPGWVEHDPIAIWNTVIACTEQALTDAALTGTDITAVGITNQRETVVAWHAETGKSLGPTIVWQDRRTAEHCEQIRAEGRDEQIRAIAGLPTDPYFSATKIVWLLNNDADVQSAAANNTLRLGTIDSWLIWNLTDGSRHITDASNAARTMLFDIHACAWSPQLCDYFCVDPAWLPVVVDSAGTLGECAPARIHGISAPICGIAGDQQSALFGQACVSGGMAKATYGTGAFVLVNSEGNAPVSHELISTVAWMLNGKPTYTLEGSVFTAGASIQWLRDGLKMIGSALEIEALAASVPDSGGVIVVPAFAGLGAPIWDPHARAAILGMTRGTTQAHIARAFLEAIAFRVRQNVEQMEREGTSVNDLRVDGGMTHNELFLQIQADVLNIPVTRPTSIETTSLGAAYLAMLGSGIAQSREEIQELWTADITKTPDDATQTHMNDLYGRFCEATELVRRFGTQLAATPA